jgi:hypothetical protein
MTDAPAGEAPDPTLRRAGAWRSRTVILLGALGVAMTIGGAVTALIARASVVQAPTASGPLRTLPVHVYAQYTQHVAAPDLTGVGVGVTIAAVGAIAVLVGAVLALARTRVA